MSRPFCCPITAIVLPLNRPRPVDERGILGSSPVAVELDEVLEKPLDVVERVGALRVAGQLDEAPDLVVGGLLDALELLLEARRIARKARPAQERHPAQAAQPLAKVALALTGHC